MQEMRQTIYVGLNVCRIANSVQMLRTALLSLIYFAQGSIKQ